MKLDRDEFVVTFDAGKAKPADLIATIREAGYTSFVATDETSPDDNGSGEGSFDDPVYTDAIARAKRENKPIVIDFMALWCVPCKRMETETFSDPAVAKLLEQVVFLKIDTDEHANLTRHFGVEGLPDIRLLKRDGTEFCRVSDFQDAEVFSEVLRGLLDSSLNVPQSGATLPGS
ncbi:DUF255 domain-containing protein [bacterium]|nr:DUF255 domain-containing protein [bacterium]